MLSSWPKHAQTKHLWLHKVITTDSGWARWLIWVSYRLWFQCLAGENYLDSFDLVASRLNSWSVYRNGRGIVSRWSFHFDMIPSSGGLTMSNLETMQGNSFIREASDRKKIKWIPSLRAHLLVNLFYFHLPTRDYIK